MLYYFVLIYGLINILWFYILKFIFKNININIYIFLNNIYLYNKYILIYF